MKNDKVKFLLCLLFFAILASITFRCAWGADMVFSGSDENFGIFQERKNLMPEYFTAFFQHVPVLGYTGGAFKLNHVLTLLFPAGFANDFRYIFFLLMSSFSMVWFLRLRGRSWLAASIGALMAFWFASSMLAAGGHIYKMAVLSFSTLCLCLVEKSVVSESQKKSTLYAVLLGVAVGMMILEQADVAILAGMFVGAYTIFRLLQAHGKRWSRWCCVLIPVAVIGLSISIRTIFSQYEQNVEQSAAVQTAEGRWDFVTQWSMVPGEWPDLIASGWSGWGSSDPEGPYWGRIGQSAEWEKNKQGFRNFKITSVYMGVIPFLLAGFGFVLALRNRKSEDGAHALFWSVAGLIGLGLAFGKYSLLYKLFYQMPLVGNIRAPIKFLENYQICMAIVAAYGIDRLADSGKVQKRFFISCAIVAGMMFFAGMIVRFTAAARMQDFAQMDFGKYAELMVQNMSNAWLHGGLLALVLGGLVFVVWKKRKLALWAGIVLGLVLAIDSVALTSRYFKAEDISFLENGNVVINYLKENQGNERIFFMEQSGIYNRWIGVDGRYHRLNVFNIWQLPRMPVEFKNFLSIVGRNQVRLWELSSIKYITAPAGIMEQISKNPKLNQMLVPVMFYRFGMDGQEVKVTPIMRLELPQDQVLLEFKGLIPRFSLFHDWKQLSEVEHCQTLASPTFDAGGTVLVDAVHEIPAPPGGTRTNPLEAETTKDSATVTVNAKAPGILMFTQRLQPGWKVHVDGKPAELLRCNYLCMGVYVPAGEHTIEFSL